MPTLKYLIEQGCADPNALSGDGRRPLHVAVAKGGALAPAAAEHAEATSFSPPRPHRKPPGNAEIIQWLVELGGAHVNATNFAQETPLYHACYFGRDEAVDYLVRLVSGGQA